MKPAEIVEMPVKPQDHEAYKRLVAATEGLAVARTIVAHPCDAPSLEGVFEARDAKIIEPVLVGPRARIEAAAEAIERSLDGIEIVDTEHSHASAEKAVALIREGAGAFLMKGSLHSDEILGAVADREKGLRTERRISHVFAMAVPTYDQPLFITDAAVNIFPDLNVKRDIVQNVIDLALALNQDPKVAILSAVETVTTKIPSTIDAAALCKMAERGQITGGKLDGPLAFDNAISPEAAKIKGIVSPVAGQANILVVPDLEAGNMLAKNLTFLGNADAAGIVLGARVPLVLTSRADTPRARMASCAVAALFADYQLKHKPGAGS